MVEALEEVLERQKPRSTGTLTRLRDLVRWDLEDRYGPGVVPNAGACRPPPFRALHG